ncbi:MAG: hypothetical protein ACRDNF_01335 [Streptosporangiaceae bacterium]
MSIYDNVASGLHTVESGETEQVFSAPVDPRTADYVHGRFG